MIHEKRTDVFLMGEGPLEQAVRGTLARDSRYRLFADRAVLKAKRAVDPKTGVPVFSLSSFALQDLLKWYWARWFGLILVDCSSYKQWPPTSTAETFARPPLSLPTVHCGAIEKPSPKDEQALLEIARRGGSRIFMIRAVQPGSAPAPEQVAVALRDQVLPYAVKHYLGNSYGLFDWWSQFPPIQ
ncbi:MAG: hypothetical protein C4521_13485 [Actinobacteria bacterium]|nr:MAG: hypothetical protein C4521_13485 [Actinomycetota bacterium]